MKEIDLYVIPAVLALCLIAAAVLGVLELESRNAEQALDDCGGSAISDSDDTCTIDSRTRASGGRVQ